MSDDKPDATPKPVEVDADELRRIEEESEPAAAKGRESPMEDAGSPGGTSGTGGTTHEQDD